MLSLPLFNIIIIILRLNSIKTWCKHLFLHQIIKWCHLSFLNLISLKRLQPNTHDCHTLKYIQILILYKKKNKDKTKISDPNSWRLHRSKELPPSMMLFILAKNKSYNPKKKKKKKKEEEKFHTHKKATDFTWLNLT